MSTNEYENKMGLRRRGQLSTSANANTDQRRKAQEGGDEGRESNDSWTMVRTYFVFVV